MALCIRSRVHCHLGSLQISSRWVASIVGFRRRIFALGGSLIGRVDEENWESLFMSVSHAWCVSVGTRTFVAIENLVCASAETMKKSISRPFTALLFLESV